MKQFIFFLALFLMVACTPHSKKTVISNQAIDQVIATLSEKDPSNQVFIEKGVKQVALLWQETDGQEADFIRFCTENYITDPTEKEQAFLKISDYLEAILGHFNEMTLQLLRNVHEPTGELLSVDEWFAAYDPSTHFSDDLYNNKLAFLIALNFPKLSLEEKESLGDNRLDWAYARLGDMFTSRIPAVLQQAYAKADRKSVV